MKPESARLEALRRRVEALALPRPKRAGVLGWAWRRWEPAARTVQLPLLEALDRELDRVGILTLADARLLRRLGVQRGRAAQLAERLLAQVDAVLAEYEPELRWAERAWRAGSLPAGTRSALQRGLVRLSRVLRVAAVFREEAPADEGPLGVLPRAAVWPRERPPRDARLAAAEFLSERARGTALDVEQKRRDLERAHELLLHLGLQQERERARALRWEVAQARERLRTAPPLRTLPALLREVRAASLHEPGRAYLLLRGLYERAVEAGDERLATAARAALLPLLPEPEALAGLVERAEWEALHPWSAANPLASVAFGLEPHRLSSLQLAAGAARFFDIADAAAPEALLAAVPGPRPRQVPHPTARMEFELTGSPAQAASFVIRDPRRVLMDLAAHAQPVRVYLEDAPQPTRAWRSSVRVYVCDASGSMQGARARLRDALLLAELDHLRRRAAQGLPFDPVLFAYFSDAPSELVLVQSAEEATRHMEQLFAHSPAEGQTNITRALVSAFDSLRDAQRRDARLAHATLVLVTDGEDRVDLELLRRVRAPMGRIDIALSFISLGNENPDLRALVLEQQEAGARAFYHALSDDDLAWGEQAFIAPWRTLLPLEVEVTPESLARLGPHLEALEQLAQEGTPAPAPVVTEGSFDALFPEKPAPAHAPPPPGREAQVADILAAVADVASLTPAPTRAGESLALLRHLLGIYGLSAPDYLQTLAAGAPAVQRALTRVRRLCAPLE